MIDLTKLRATIEVAEGFRPHAYLDSEGYWTIGHGILIDQRGGGGITLDESRYLVGNRIVRVRDALNTKFPWWAALDEPRARALAEMCYVLGPYRLMGFIKMIAALKAGDWSAAAAECLDSKFARQVGDRELRIAETFRTG